ncbi:MAG TPA: ACT domain-containing protein, partial [Clostridia bacterium]
ILSELTGIFAEHGANITNVAVYRGHSGKSIVVIGINSQNTDKIENDIEQNGYKIIYKLKNI